MCDLGMVQGQVQARHPVLFSLHMWGQKQGGLEALRLHPSRQLLRPPGTSFMKKGYTLSSRCSPGECKDVASSNKVAQHSRPGVPIHLLLHCQGPCSSGFSATPFLYVMNINGTKMCRINWATYGTNTAT